MACDGVLHHANLAGFLPGSFFSVGTAGAAAELAASNKMVKYAGLSSQGEFVLTVVDSHGPINRNALQFLSKFGRQLVDMTGKI